MNWNNCIMPALTSSYDAFEHQEPLWQKIVEGKQISCRRVFIPSDVPIVIRWKRILWGSGADFGSVSQAMNEHFEVTAKGLEGQAFMLFWQERPLLQLDIVEESNCDISVLSPLVRKDDFCMYMHFNPEIALVPVQKMALRVFCEWCKKEGVPRIWTTLLSVNLLGSAILVSAGFDLIEQSLPDDDSELYVYPPLPS